MRCSDVLMRPGRAAIDPDLLATMWHPIAMAVVTLMVTLPAGSLDTVLSGPLVGLGDGHPASTSSTLCRLPSASASTKAASSRAATNTADRLAASALACATSRVCLLNQVESGAIRTGFHPASESGSPSPKVNPS